MPKTAIRTTAHGWALRLDMMLLFNCSSSRRAPLREDAVESAVGGSHGAAGGAPRVGSNASSVDSQPLACSAS
eukprot:7036993-Pyramimonas_sp.AAC.1